MKKLIFLLVLAILTLFILPSNVNARSGCCSHHGGVCGCGCCDGTSLSTTCAPYYPKCSRPVYTAPITTKKPVVVPIVTTAPTKKPTPIPEVKSITTESPNTPIVESDAVTNKKIGLGDLITALSLGGLVYLGIKYNKLKNKLNEN
jgi:hypothetical protein